VNQSSLDIFLFALRITAPTFALMFLGMALVSLGCMSSRFIKGANQLVYKLGLPLILFTTCASANLHIGEKLNLLIAFALMTFIVFGGSWLTALLCKQTDDAGVIVQGAFRGNLVILGLAFAVNAYGERGMAMATLPVAFTVVIYNVLSVFILDRNKSWAGTFKGIITNPLILAIAAGWLYNLSPATFPQAAQEKTHLITQFVLPLALVCIGGSLNGRRLVFFDGASIIANLWKLVLSPLIACALGIGLGVQDELLVILFLLAAAPTAAASYVMAEAAGANGKLAATIVAQTTFLALFSVTLGLMMISHLQ